MFIKKKGDRAVVLQEQFSEKEKNISFVELINYLNDYNLVDD